jgi:DNA-binding protein YbaB
LFRQHHFDTLRAHPAQEVSYVTAAPFDRDILAGLSDLRDTVDHVSAQLSAGERTSATGRDPAGAVAVTMTADGAVSGVELDSGWRAKLGSAGLGDAVAAAVAAAQRASTERWAEAVEADREPAPPAPAESGSSEPATVPPDRFRGADTGEYARELLGLLEEVESRLAGLPDVVERELAREVDATGPRGTIRVVAQQGSVVSVHADDRWLAEAPRDRVEDELGAALRAALPGLNHRLQAAVRGVSPIGELFSLLDDPAELMRRLGLPATNV